MSRSIRIYYGDEHALKGRCRMNFNWDGVISFASVVEITASEATAFGSVDHIAAPAGSQLYDYHIGDANIWVSNISPHNGGVEFILHVDWPQPLSVAVTITVHDPVEVHQRYGH